MSDAQAYADPDFRMELTPLGRYMLEFRYLHPLPDGGLEAPEELLRRVARNVAEAEGDDRDGWAARFFDLMADRRFLPNAPTLLGAGGPLQQLHACFVLPLADSIDEVFTTLRQAAVVHARGGGTGFSFSALRARGAPIATGGAATGPVPLLQVFDTETEVLKGGGTGWGANMGVLRCDHPDVAEFVSAKSEGALRNFNLSVGVTDEFVAAVRAGGDFALRDPRDGSVVTTVDAAALFEQLCTEAWRTGDPGLLFLDAVARGNPVPALGPIEATNPCGEAPLLPYEACCLGGINVARFATDDGVHWRQLEDAAALALRMMDDVIEVSRYPLPEIAEATRRTRKVGIGIMGLADLLIELDLPYDSEDAVALAGELMACISRATHEASVDLGVERGSFPAFGQSTWAGAGVDAMRNATTTSNAPNSTIGPIAGCSAGIEPLFAVGYERVLASGDRNRELHPAFVEVAKDRGFASDELFAAVRAAGSVRELEAVPADVRRRFVTAHDIEAAWHVRHQAAVQAHTDLGVSKTINLPEHATVNDVGAAFLLAHELGCKGSTVFRDGTGREQFLVRGSDTSQEACEVCT